MVLSSLRSGLALRLEVLDALATAQRLQQLPRQQRATLQIALEMCSGAGVPKPHADTAAAWLPRFHLAAAELEASAGELPAAKTHAAAALAAAQQSGQLQAQVLMSRVMLVHWISHAGFDGSCDAVCIQSTE
jgi:hypothetical protein